MKFLKYRFNNKYKIIIKNNSYLIKKIITVIKITYNEIIFNIHKIKSFSKNYKNIKLQKSLKILGFQITKKL